MKLDFKHITLLGFLLFFNTLGVFADDYPTINVTCTFADADGNEGSDNNFSGSAPVTASFMAGATYSGNWTANFKWCFYLDKDTVPYITRYEEDTKYTFNTAGTHRIVLYATFTKDGQTYELSNEDNPIYVNVSESKLEKPNAFSPNGDGINDEYQAKNGYQSIVEFQAYIFNRLGQKIYEWTNPAKGYGWNGTFHGKPAKEGVYFVLVKAKGADGRVFNIKKDVNLLRGYDESGSTTSNE